jgi:carbon monoxide dehydrogenase subunit G
MARYVDAIDLELCPEGVFDYLADFSTIAEWDPGVVSAKRITPGVIRTGTRFRVVVSFLSRTLEFEYEILEYERPHRLVLRGTHEAVVSTDEISFLARGSGTRVTYEARLELTGLLRLADPLLNLLFQHIGRVAMRGLRERMAGEPAARTPGIARQTARGGA